MTFLPGHLFDVFMQRDVLHRGRKKNVHLFKKLPPGRRYKQRFSLLSLHYFPEHTVISSIFHAYGHECLTLPCLCLNKKEISWLQISLEEWGEREKPRPKHRALQWPLSHSKMVLWRNLCCMFWVGHQCLAQTRSHTGLGYFFPGLTVC